MLGQQYRFHGYGSLKFLFHKGRTFRSRSLSVRVASNARRTESRCSVIVTKKVQKAAPRRNRIRRRVYEVIRLHWDNIKPAQDILISVYDPQAGVMPFAELEQQVIRVLKQAEVWQPSQKDGKTT